MLNLLNNSLNPSQLPAFVVKMARLLFRHKLTNDFITNNFRMSVAYYNRPREAQVVFLFGRQPSFRDQGLLQSCGSDILFQLQGPLLLSGWWARRVEKHMCEVFMDQAWIGSTLFLFTVSELSYMLYSTAREDRKGILAVAPRGRGSYTQVPRLRSVVVCYLFLSLSYSEPATKSY